MDAPKRPFTLSLRQFLALPFLALFILMGAIMVWAFYLGSLNMGHQMEQHLASVLSNRVNAYLTHVFDEPVSAVNATAKLYHTDKINFTDPNEQTKQLAAVMLNFPELTTLEIGLEDGRAFGVNRSLNNGILHSMVVVSGDRPYRDVYSIHENGQEDQLLFKDPNPYIPNSQPWYKQAIQDRIAGWNPLNRYTPSEIADVSGNFGVAFSMPLFDDHKQLVGVINSDIALGQISRYLKLLPLGDGGVAFIANQQDQIIGISDDSPLFKKLAASAEKTGRAQLVHFDNQESSLIRMAGEHLLKNGLGSSYLDVDGVDYVERASEFRSATGLDLKIVVLLPENHFFPSMSSSISSMLTFALITLLITIAMVFYLAHRLSKPIVQMSHWAEKLSLGDWQVLNKANKKATRDYPINEIRLLRKSFSNMANNLYETVSTLEERVAERTAELEHVNNNLFELSNTDGLTGIANRRKFDEVINSEWSRASRTGQPLVVALIDVDWFKKYNDHSGHLAGDDCLRNVAHVLKSKIRRSSDLIARYGGEEFAIISPGINKSNAIEMANMICAAVADTALAHPASPFGKITISIGVALMVPTLDTDPTTLIQAADEALYHAKESGRNQAVCAEIEIADEQRYPQSEFTFMSAQNYN